MARVVMQAVVSVDGYIAYPDDTVAPLFDWYGNGDTELSAKASGWTFRVSRTSADYVQPFWDAIKVVVIGRHLFDTTNGWDGNPAAGDELVVVTHRPLPGGLARRPPARTVPHRRLRRGGHRARQEARGRRSGQRDRGRPRRAGVLGRASRRGRDGRRAGGSRRRSALLRQPHRHGAPQRSRPGGPGRPRAAPALHGQALTGHPICMSGQQPGAPAAGRSPLRAAGDARGRG